MPKFRRLVVPGYPHHVTQRGVRSQQTFFTDGDYREYLNLAVARLNKVALEIWAYCLMPNHIHAIVIPRRPDSLAKFFGPVHRSYARSANYRNGWRGHLWQQRFYSVVMDESHTLAAMRYVERNPVRASMCRNPADWPWSSARAHVHGTEDQLLHYDRSCALVSNWGEYVGNMDDQQEIDGLRNQTATGRPAGAEAFIDEIEALSGRKVRPRSPGVQKYGAPRAE